LNSLVLYVDIIIITAPGRGAAYCDQFFCLSVCVSVFLSASISLEPLDRSSNNFLQIPCGRGSVLLWWHCDMLYTSSFTDNITFGHNGPYGDAWMAHPQPSTACGVVRPGQRLMSMNPLF